MDEPLRLTPAQALEKFGKLTAQAGRSEAHMHFDSPEGEWRPEFDSDVRLIGYRLFKAKKPMRKVVFRPKGKR